MADYFIYIESATGRAKSSTDDAEFVANFSKEGFEFVTVDDSTKGGIWNPQTRQFDPRPEKKVVSKLDFLDLFTDSELENILSSPNIKVKIFVKKLELADGRINLKSNRMTAAINGMETLGLIGPGRAAEIIS